MAKSLSIDEPTRQIIINIEIVTYLMRITLQIISIYDRVST